MLRWASEDLLHLKPEEIGEHYGRYRLHLPEAEFAMARHLGVPEAVEFGQLDDPHATGLHRGVLATQRGNSTRWAS